MKQLKAYTIVGFFFVLILGTLFHFLYEWTNQCYIVGFFALVSESVWEHMKLLFFPMLLYIFFMIWRFNERFPCVIAAFFFGNLAGTWCIPLLYYAYTSVLGTNILFIDLAIFAISTGIAFYLAYKFTLSCRLQPYTIFLCILICMVLLCFLVFTYHPPAFAMFSSAHS